MPQFTVDEDLAALVEKLAKPRPFENLTFNAALRRVLLGKVAASNKDGQLDDLEVLLAESMALRKNAPKKTPSPSASEWAANVPELSAKKGLTSWKAICKSLRIETAGDSARRKLKNWVKINRPSWPSVPEIN